VLEGGLISLSGEKDKLIVAAFPEPYVSSRCIEV
jgi:hypothetical protein